MSTNFAFAAQKEGIYLETGSTFGNYTYQSTDAEFDALIADHSLAGSVSNFYLAKILDNNVMYGGGMQSYVARGSTTSSSLLTVEGSLYYFTATLDHTLTVSGPFALIGYNIPFGDTANLQPQLRFGFSNTAKYSGTLTLSSGSFSASTTEEQSTDVAPLVIVLPINFVASEHLEIGVQYQILDTGLEVSSTGEKYTAIINKTLSLSIGYYF